MPTSGGITPAVGLTTTTFGASGHGKGKVTATQSKLLGTGDFIKTTSVYDVFGRLKTTFSNNVLLRAALSDLSDISYDGASNIVGEDKLVHESLSIFTTIINTTNIDNDGRTIAEHIKLDNLPEQQLCAMKFNEKDLLVVEYMGGDSAAHLQQIDYNYLNNRALHRVNGGVAIGTDLFGYQLNYNNSFAGWNPGTGRLNGDISSTSWQNVGENIYVQYYGYDHINRLLGVSTGEKTSPSAPTPVNANYNNTTYSYDKRGNFIDVMRKQNDVTIDQLHYNYIGTNANQLESMNENSLDDKGYKKKNTNLYVYDGNGNMTRDPQKGITIQYNHLDLPDLITWEDGRKISLLYDGDGALHRREVFDASSIRIQKHDYIGQMEYLDDFKYAIMYSQGRIINQGLTEYLEYLYLDHQQDMDGIFEAQMIESSGNIVDNTTLYDASQTIVLNEGFEVYSTAIFTATVDPPPTYVEDWQYEWNITDHLGNLKMVYRDLNDNGSIDPSSEILQIQDYFAYGMRRNHSFNTSLSNPYQFNGIDHVNEFGLDWSMATFRSLDAAIGRWGQMDPKSSAVKSVSPYVAFGATPTMQVDPEGDLAWFVPVLIGAALGGTAGGVIAQNNGSSFWKGFGVGAIVGGGIGFGVTSALSASGNIGGIFTGGIGSSATHATTTLGWNVGTNALLTANINIASSVLQGRDFDGIFKSGLVGLGAGAIGGAIGGTFHQGNLGQYEGVFSQSAIKTTNYITAGLNGFGDRLVSTLSNGEGFKQALFNGLIGAGEGLYFSKIGNKYAKINGPVGKVPTLGVAGRYISSSIAQAGTSVPGLGLSVGSIHSALWGALNLNASGFAFGLGKDKLGFKLLGRGLFYVGAGILGLETLSPKYTSSLFND